MKGRVQGLVVTGLVAVLLAAVTFVLLDRRTPSDIVIQSGTYPTIVVEVSGAVATPGIYELPGASRLQQAIDGAGGLTADADVSSLNLAARLGDGEDIAIPSKRETPAGGDAGRSTPGVVTSGSGSEPGDGSLIDLNTASAAELDALPGVGPVIAERILEYRQVNGPFVSVDELAEIQGISPAMVEELRPLVSVGG